MQRAYLTRRVVNCFHYNYQDVRYTGVSDRVRGARYDITFKAVFKNVVRVARRRLWVAFGGANATDGRNRHARRRCFTKIVKDQSNRRHVTGGRSRGARYRRLAVAGLVNGGATGRKSGVGDDRGASRGDEDFDDDMAGLYLWGRDGGHGRNMMARSLTYINGYRDVRALELSFGRGVEVLSCWVSVFYGCVLFARVGRCVVRGLPPRPHLLTL